MMKYIVSNLGSGANARRSRVRGVGLLEVLITLLVMGVGMFAMSKLHAILIQYGVTTNNRAVATMLAQAKIEELRHFRLVNGTADECADVPCFVSIKKSDIDEIIPVGGLTFLRSVTLNDKTDDYFIINRCQTKENCFLYKYLEVKVKWSDINGEDAVVLRSIIYPSNNAVAGVTGAIGSGNDSPGPRVLYTPVGLPDAVPIEIGDSKYREASKPVPDISQDKERQNTVVKFNNTSYSTPDNSILSNEEYVTVSCVCEFSSGNQGMVPTRQVWNAKSKKLEFELGFEYDLNGFEKFVTKPLVGQVLGKVPDPTKMTLQQNLCDVCCRDHHDVGGDAYPKYSPQQDSFPHKHYYPNGSGVLQVATSGQYLESCRMQRINGLYYVLPDWLLRDLVVMPKDDYLSVPATLAKYQTYIQQSIAHWALDEGAAPDKNTLADRNFIKLAPGQQAQLLARGIYVDTINKCRPGARLLDSWAECPTGTDPNQVDNTYITDVKAIKAAADTKNDWRRHVSVSEVNLTVLGTWTSDQVKRVTVDNQPVQDILDPVNGYYTSYYRGRVTGYSGDGATTGLASITATARTGNTGLTSGVMNILDPNDVDGYDRYLDEGLSAKSDSILVERLASLTTYGISGDFVLVAEKNDKPKPTTWGAKASPSAGVICTSTGNQNGPGYSCVVPSGWSGTITPFATAAGSNNDDAVGTNYYFKQLFTPLQPYPPVTAAKTNQNYNLCKVQSLCQ